MFGYVGAAVARALSPHVRSIATPVRASATLPALVNLVPHELSADGLGDVPGLIAAIRPNLVIHCAAYGIKPQERDASIMFDVNTRATIDICNAATQHAKAIIIAGSVSEYGAAAEAPFSETAPLEMRKIYGASKAAATIASLAMATQREFPCVVLRLFNVFGPAEAPHRLVSSLVRNLRNGNRVPLSPGDQERDFVYIDDIAGAFLAAARRFLTWDNQTPTLAEIVSVCTGTPVSVRELCETLARKIGCSSDLLEFGALPYRPDDVMKSYGSPENARKLLGWTRYSQEVLMLEIKWPKNSCRAGALVTVSIPVLNESGHIDRLIEALRKFAADEPKYAFEFLFTDNASSDDTFEQLCRFAETDPRVRILRFSRNFGFQNSVLTNFLEARGDAAIEIDADLQDPLAGKPCASCIGHSSCCRFKSDGHVAARTRPQAAWPMPSTIDMAVAHTLSKPRPGEQSL